MYNTYYVGEFMDFIDRKQEIEQLHELEKRNSFFLVVKGRRRIGKTSLLLRAYPHAHYLFVGSSYSESELAEEYCEKHSLPKVSTFRDLIMLLLRDNKPIIIDEFQNLLTVDKKLFSTMQELYDENKNQMKLALCGSSYTLMTRIFSSSASPLYGRKTAELTIQNLPFKALAESLPYEFEEMLKFWFVFSGIPYYYTLIEELKWPAFEKGVEMLFFSSLAPLKTEGKAVSAIEAGKEGKVLSTLFSAVAKGKTKFNEIAGAYGNDNKKASRYLEWALNETAFVRKAKPLLGKGEYRYYIQDPLLLFWYGYVQKFNEEIEKNEFDAPKQYFKENISSFMGIQFENFIEQHAKTLLPMEWSSIGKQWGKQRDSKESYEIDLVALNEKTGIIGYAECKWKKEVNAKEIMAGLLEKSQNVAKEKAMEGIFILFAKSFSKKISEFEGKTVHCIDLKEIERKIRGP